MLGSKIFTFGPKSGVSANACVELLEAAAAPEIASAPTASAITRTTRRVSRRLRLCGRRGAMVTSFLVRVDSAAPQVLPGRGAQSTLLPSACAHAAEMLRRAPLDEKPQSFGLGPAEEVLVLDQL